MIQLDFFDNEDTQLLKEEIRKLLGKKDIPERFEDEDKTCVSCGVNLASCGSYYCGRCIDNGNY